MLGEPHYIPDYERWYGAREPPQEGLSLYIPRETQQWADQYARGAVRNVAPALRQAAPIVTAILHAAPYAATAASFVDARRQERARAEEKRARAAADLALKQQQLAAQLALVTQFGEEQRRHGVVVTEIERERIAATARTENARLSLEAAKHNDEVELRRAEQQLARIDAESRAGRRLAKSDYEMKQIEQQKAATQAKIMAIEQRLAAHASDVELRKVDQQLAQIEGESKLDRRLMKSVHEGEQIEQQKADRAVRVEELTWRAEQLDADEQKDLRKHARETAAQEHDERRLRAKLAKMHGAVEREIRGEKLIREGRQQHEREFEKTYEQRERELAQRRQATEQLAKQLEFEVARDFAQHQRKGAETPLIHAGQPIDARHIRFNPVLDQLRSRQAERQRKVDEPLQRPESPRVAEVPPPITEQVMESFPLKGVTMPRRYNIPGDPMAGQRELLKPRLAPSHGDLHAKLLIEAVRRTGSLAAALADPLIRAVPESRMLTVEGMNAALRDPYTRVPPALIRFLVPPEEWPQHEDLLFDRAVGPPAPGQTKREAIDQFYRSRIVDPPQQYLPFPEAMSTRQRAKK